NTGIDKPPPSGTGFTVVPDSTTLNTYEFDIGRLQSIEDPRHNVTAYGYDEANRRISVSRARDPINGVTVTETTWSEYDLNGNVTTNYLDYQNAQSQTVHGSGLGYGYDKLNRRVTVTYPAVSGVHNEQNNIFNQRITTYDA